MPMGQKEIWKVYKDNTNAPHGALWEVSTEGRVKKNGELYKPKLKNRYLRFSCYSVHRAVAELFIPNPENKPFVDHIDTNIYNNRVENLRWVTHKENMNNPLTIEHMSGSNNSMSAENRKKMKKEKIEKIGKLISIANTGKHWYNNGIERAFTYECPEGYVKGFNLQKGLAS